MSQTGFARTGRAWTRSRGREFLRKRVSQATANLVEQRTLCCPTLLKSVETRRLNGGLVFTKKNKSRRARRLRQTAHSNIPNASVVATGEFVGSHSEGLRGSRSKPDAQAKDSLLSNLRLCVRLWCERRWSKVSTQASSWREQLDFTAHRIQRAAITGRWLRPKASRS